MTAFDQLADEPRWVLWRWDERGGRPTKVPYQRDGRLASSTDPSTWCTLRQLDGAQGFNGVGIILTGDGLGGIDLDHCRDPLTGEIDDWALGIIKDFRSYAEVSPSGTGVKILASGAPKDLPGNKWRPEGVAPKPGGLPHVDVFVDKRFFTVTRNVLEIVPDEIVDGGDIDGPWERMSYRIGLQRAPVVRESVDLPAKRELDSELLDRMRSLPLVWARWTVGKDGGHDRSSNDAALAVAMASNHFSHQDIRAALEGYDLGQIGSGKLTGGDAERQVVRLLELSEPHRPKAQEQHPHELENIARVIGDSIAMAQERERKESEKRAEQERQSVLFTLKEASVMRFLQEEPPPRKWILPNVLPLGVAAMIGGSGGVGKSYTTLFLGCCIALGIDFWGLGECKPGGVVIFSAEDDRDEMHRRLHKVLDWIATMTGHRVDGLELERRLFIGDRVGKDNLMTVVRDREVQRTAMAERIARTASQVPDLSLVILDPLSRFRGGSGNAEEEATRFVEAVESVRTYTGATVLLPVHMNKQASRTGDGSQDAIRGSSALVDGMRWVGTLVPMGEEKAKERGIPETDGKNWVRFEIAKGNYSAPFEGLWLRRQAGGVLFPDSPPEVAERGPKSDTKYTRALQGLCLILDNGPRKMSELRQVTGSGKDIPIGVNNLPGVIERAVAEGYLATAPDPETPTGLIVRRVR